MDSEDSTDEERLQTELSLLQAIYPNEITFDARARDVTYASTHVSLCLRLTPGYPSSSPPDVISAAGPHKQDLRDEAKAIILELTPGEEALDEIIARFKDLVASLPEVQSSRSTATLNSSSSNTSKKPEQGTKTLTVILWLHHLLSTTKRKAILSPPVCSPPVTGISKPGYPGVLIFSGPADSVREHVKELKGMRWQAFHVRLEEESNGDKNGKGVWKFGHGTGVKEVESMGEVVASVIGEREREIVVRCLGIK